MIIAIDDTSSTPIYTQIRNSIVRGISDGRLAPSEQLPTVRALATEIGINTMTVSKAYQILKQEGFIVTDRRSGARVNSSFKNHEGLSPEQEETLRQLISEAKVHGIGKDKFMDICAGLFDEGRNV